MGIWECTVKNEWNGDRYHINGNRSVVFKREQDDSPWDFGAYTMDEKYLQKVLLGDPIVLVPFKVMPQL